MHSLNRFGFCSVLAGQALTSSLRWFNSRPPRDLEKRCRNVEMPIEQVDVTENDTWRRTRSVGHNVRSGSGPSSVNDKQASYWYGQLTTTEIAAEYIGRVKF